MSDRITVLQAINEVRRKVKISTVSAIDDDKDALTKLQYLNDVIAEMSDYGNWRELYREVIVSIVANQTDYGVSGVSVQNINEVAISTRSSPLSFVSIDDIRRLQRTNSTGEPTQFSIKSVDSAGNPIITVHPQPNTADASKFFTIGYYLKPPVYATADAGTQIPFPARAVIQGLLTKTILDESDGEPTARYLTNLEAFQNMAQESYNRYNGDTGGNVYFRPGRRR
jgi:hypothetical protein